MSLFNTDEIVKFNDGTSTFSDTIDNQVNQGTSVAGALATATNDAKTQCTSETERLRGDLTNTGSSLTTSNQKVTALTTRLRSVADVANALYTKANDAKRELETLKTSCTPSN